VRQEVADQRPNGRVGENRACEGEGARCEDLGAGRRLVIGHLRGEPLAEQVGDLRQHMHVPRRGGAGRIDLDAAVAE
jgi:hypothetical protein